MALQLEDDASASSAGAIIPMACNSRFGANGVKICSDFNPAKRFQGYRESSMAAFISAVLDEVIVHAAMAAGLSPVTADLRVRSKNRF
jgi:membrane-bound ClpP family serine protease